MNIFLFARDELGLVKFAQLWRGGGRKSKARQEIGVYVYVSLSNSQSGKHNKDLRCNTPGATLSASYENSLVVIPRVFWQYLLMKYCESFRV